MEPDRLAQLGLTVEDAGGVVEAVLSLDQAVVNPLTRRVVPAVTFALAEDCLIPVEPPELVGLPPLSVEGASGPRDLEARLLAAFEEHVAGLQRCTAELQALGVAPRVEPESLELHAELEVEDYRFVLGGDKRGGLHVAQVYRAGALLRSDVGQAFVAAHFPDRDALATFLLGLMGEQSPPRPREGVTYAEMRDRFGPFARAPDTTALEVVTDFRVRGERYRFVAARIRGRTFRALLVGPDGKKWADHFALEDFGGVADVASRALGIQPSDIEWIDGEGGA
jgi:hypothetical protein